MTVHKDSGCCSTIITFKNLKDKYISESESPLELVHLTLSEFMHH